MTVASAAFPGRARKLNGWRVDIYRCGTECTYMERFGSLPARYSYFPSGLAGRKSRPAGRPDSSLGWAKIDKIYRLTGRRLCKCQWVDIRIMVLLGNQEVLSNKREWERIPTHMYKWAESAKTFSNCADCRWCPVEEKRTVQIIQVTMSMSCKHRSVYRAFYFVSFALAMACPKSIPG